MSSPEIEILLAEDEEHIARLVSFKLSRDGYRITHARNGQEAIELLESKPWSLVILDVMMPIQDGWQVLQELRAREAMRALPVLMLTAKGSAQDAAQAAELGATRFLKKPFDPTELSSVVKSMVSPA